MAVIKIVPMPGAVGDKGDEGAVGPQGQQGETGLQGPAGADALWSYNGEYNPGAGYAVGDVVTFDGQLWYRKNSNGGNVGDTPSEGFIWDLLASKGADGLEGQQGPQGEEGPAGQDGETPVETSFTVNGGTLGTQPTFNGAPLFSGTYVKTGPMVHFQVQVDMDNITNFGTGQYFIDLPFPSKYGYQVRSGCFHDISTDKQYAIGGHVFEGQSQLTLTFTNSSGQDEAFDHNSPVTLNVADNFHISGTYISE
jgi:hypothetical protein